jgi:hypothetical protein
MTTERRTSEQGHEFSVTIIRLFLLEALSHDAVTDAVDAMLFEHIVENRLHPSVITENLRPLIVEVLDTATLEDWQYVSGTLIEEARDVLRGESIDDPNAQQAPDPGELREALGELYARGLTSPRKALRAWKLVRELRTLTGVSLAEILVNARTDAVAIGGRDEYDAARARRSSGQTPATPDVPEVDAEIDAMQQKLRGLMDDGVFVCIEYAEGKKVDGWIDGLTETEVSVDRPGRRSEAEYLLLAEIVDVTEIAASVRPVMQEEALALLRLGESTFPLSRKRAGIILASNSGCTIREIADVQKSDWEFVRQVITEFNEKGLESLE